jgi:hypothetical protein
MVSSEDQCAAPRSPACRPWRGAEFARSTNFAGIKRPVPPWRFAPFGAPAAFDVNLCTDSVLPGVIAPVRLRCAWVLWPHLSGNPCNVQLLEFRMGPFPALASQRHSSILTGLFCLTCRLCPPPEGVISCRRPGKSPAESPGDHRRRPIPSAFFRRLSWDFANFCSASLASHQAVLTDAAEDFRASRASLRYTRHPNSRSGACGRSSRYPAPET